MEIKFLIASAGGLLKLLYMPFHPLLDVIILLVIFDYVSGISSAIINKNLSSKIGGKGIVKKLMIFVVIAIAGIIDNFFVTDISVIQDMVILFYAVNEIISILENVHECGLPLPKKLVTVLKILKDKWLVSGNLDEVTKEEKKNE